MASVALEVTAVRHADRSQGAALAMGPKNPVSRLMSGVSKQARDVPIRSTTMLNCSFRGWSRKATMYGASAGNAISKGPLR